MIADLLRNPRRTLSTMVGVTLGVGLFCGVLFFVDGLSASMTQRAVAPLPIDMQRIISDRFGSAVTLTQKFELPVLASGERSSVRLEIANTGRLAAHEVTVRSVPGPALTYVIGSAEVDGAPVTGFLDNPFAHGPGQTGLNLGTIQAGQTRSITYAVEAGADVSLDDVTVTSAYSTRESVSPVPANEPGTVSLEDLVGQIARVAGVSHASQLSIADLGPDTLSAAGLVATGPAKIFGFDDDYAIRDTTIDIVEGGLGPDGGVLSAEAAAALDVGIGQTVTVRLPDGTTIDLVVSGIADLSRSRSLFSSRRGGDLETFIYTRNAVVVSPDTFADVVYPAYQNAAALGETRLKSPPGREIVISLDREVLDSDPATAAVETQRIAGEVSAIAAHQDYLLDNISNTLMVAAADAEVAKRLFVFLGVPGALLAAILAAYAGNVLADAQRREQATLRIRGASRRHLLRMLALRTSLLTATGSIAGLALGYVSAAAIVGRESLDRASISSLFISGLLGTAGGFLATGLALYTTGRRSIDREINEDRALLAVRPPLWRRLRLDIVLLTVVIAGSVVALTTHAFDGAPGSVYFGRAVDLNLTLLVLPVTAWMGGSILAARLIGTTLHRTSPASTPDIGRPLRALFRLGIGRRPWSISNGAIVASLIVALAATLATFTASYDAAKMVDARYANGADIRITPSPTAHRTYGPADGGVFETTGITGVTPVIYGLSNVILRSARTSDPANLAAIDPVGFSTVAPIADEHFAGGAEAALLTLESDTSAVLLSEDMASFLKVEPGDTLLVLLSRATEDQVEVELHISGLYERLPGFPDGADAVMSIDRHVIEVPNKLPDFFLASTDAAASQEFDHVVEGLRAGPGATDSLQIDTRVTTLARDQSSLAALNIAGLVGLDSGFALAMAAVTIAIFVFGLLLQRRREYIALRAQGLEPRSIRALITAEASTVAIGGILAGLAVGMAMGLFFVAVLRPLFVLAPRFTVPIGAIAMPVALVTVATLMSSVIGSRLVNRLQPAELLRDE